MLSRWLGVGLLAVLSVVTIGLWATGRLQLYINPAQAWFAVGMAVIALVGAAASFVIPLGAEAEHDHDHGDHDHGTEWGPAALATIGGVAASAVAVAALVLPPASLSVDLAMDRDTGTPPLFAGADDIALAASGDTADFGIGEWSTVFASAANPDVYVGSPVILTGFVTPGEGGIRLGRLVITHCVIDAQPAAVPVATTETFTTGEWVRVEGTITADAQGRLTVTPTAVTAIDEPSDPYEY